MEVNFSVFGLVPLRIEQEVLRINEFLDFSSFESGAVRNSLSQGVSVQILYEDFASLQRYGSQKFPLPLPSRESHPPSHP